MDSAHRNVRCTSRDLLRVLHAPTDAMEFCQPLKNVVITVTASTVIASPSFLAELSDKRSARPNSQIRVSPNPVITEESTVECLSSGTAGAIALRYNINGEVAVG